MIAAWVAAALAVEPTLAARPFADGLVRDGAWSQVRVTLTAGDVDEAGRIELVGYDDAVLASRDVALPRGSVRALALPVSLVDPAPVAVRWWRGDAAPIVQPLVWRWLDPSTRVVVVIGDAYGDLGHLRSPASEKELTLALVEPADLPDRAAMWAIADDIVWPRADASRVSEVQQQAVVDAVALGQRLVVTFGDGVDVGTGPLAGALPVVPGGVGLVDVGPLAAALGGKAPAGPLPAALSALRPGAAVLAASEAPLWAIASHGAGDVTWIAVDPALAAVQALAPRRAGTWQGWLWLSDAGSDVGLGRAPPERPTAPGFGADDGLVFALGVGHAAPPLAPWIWFALAFVVWVVPVEAFVLSRLRRRPWTWVTFPLSSLLFFGVGATLGVKDRLSWNVGRSVTVFDALPGGTRAAVDTWLVVYTVDPFDVVVTSGGDGGLVRPLEGRQGFLTHPRRTDDGRRGAFAFRTQTATTTFLHDAWTGPLPGVLTLDAGTVRSTLPFAVEASYCDEEDCWPLGTVPAGGALYGVGPLRSAPLPWALPRLRPGTWLVGQTTEPVGLPTVSGVPATWETTTWLRYPLSSPWESP